jgi:hypothetical protein
VRNDKHRTQFEKTKPILKKVKSKKAKGKNEGKSSTSPEGYLKKQSQFASG